MRSGELRFLRARCVKLRYGAAGLVRFVLVRGLCLVVSWLGRQGELCLFPFWYVGWRYGRLGGVGSVGVSWG